MTARTRWLSIGIIIIVGLAIAYLYRLYSVRTLVKPMSVHDRVVNVLESWANLPSPPTDGQELEVIWDRSGRSFEFFPSAAQVLTTKLQTEFHDSKSAVLRYTEIYGAANPSGKVKTVKNLADAVRQNYTPQ